MQRRPLTRRGRVVAWVSVGAGLLLMFGGEIAFGLARAGIVGRVFVIAVGAGVFSAGSVYLWAAWRHRRALGR